MVNTRSFYSKIAGNAKRSIPKANVKDKNKLRKSKKISKELVNEKTISMTEGNAINQVNADLNNTQSPMMNTSILPLLPKFHGQENENFQFFITQFDQICDMAKTQNLPKLILLKAQLKSKALEYLSNNEQLNAMSDYDTFVSKLKQKFGKQENFVENQDKFATLKQKPDQTIQDIADEVENLAKKYIGNLDQNNEAIGKFFDQIKTSKFIEVLKSPIRLEVKKMAPSSFAQAVKLAKQIDAALQQEITINNVDTSSELSKLQAQNETTNLVLTEVLKEINNLKISPAPAQNQINHHSPPQTFSPQNVQCLICFKRHITKDCWYFPHIIKPTGNQQQQTPNNVYPYPEVYEKNPGHYQTGHRRQQYEGRQFRGRAMNNGQNHQGYRNFPQHSETNRTDFSAGRGNGNRVLRGRGSYHRGFNTDRRNSYLN